MGGARLFCAAQLVCPAAAVPRNSAHEPWLASCLTAIYLCCLNFCFLIKSDMYYSEESYWPLKIVLTSWLRFLIS